MPYIQSGVVWNFAHKFSSDTAESANAITPQSFASQLEWCSSLFDAIVWVTDVGNIFGPLIDSTLRKSISRTKRTKGMRQNDKLARSHWPKVSDSLWTTKFEIPAAEF